MSQELVEYSRREMFCIFRIFLKDYWRREDEVKLWSSLVSVLEIKAMEGSKIRCSCFRVPMMHSEIWNVFHNMRIISSASTITQCRSFLKSFQDAIAFWSNKNHETPHETSTAGVHKMRLLHRHSLFHWLWHHTMNFYPQKRPNSSFENNTGRTYGRTDGQTDRRTDTTSYRDA